MNRGLGKVETVLKTAMSPHEPVEMFIDHYFLLIGDRNVSNLQRILELKGLKRAEQQQMVDLFLKKHAAMENLQENSAVMSLWQGMPAHVSNQGVVAPSAGVAGNMAGLVLGGASGGSGNATSGGTGTSGVRDSNPYQLGSILSHSPFAALAAQRLNSPGIGGVGRLSSELITGGSGLFDLGQDKDAGVGSSTGVGGATGQGGQLQGGAFAAGKKLHNIRKFVAGMRAKKDQEPTPPGNPSS